MPVRHRQLIAKKSGRLGNPNEPNFVLVALDAVPGRQLNGNARHLVNSFDEWIGELRGGWFGGWFSGLLGDLLGGCLGEWFCGLLGDLMI